MVNIMGNIDPSKKYTCNGYPVINIRIVEKTFSGIPCTFPVKGTIIKGKRTREFGIWTIKGVADPVWGRGHNLKEVK